MSIENSSRPTQAPRAKRRWSKPSLAIAAVKEVTAGQGPVKIDAQGSGS